MRSHVVPLSALALLLGCEEPPPTEASASAPLVSTQTPFFEGSVAGPLPPLGLRGRGAYPILEVANAHDLDPAPGSDLQAWRNAAVSTPHAATPALATHLDGALADAAAELARLDAGPLRTAFALLDKVPGVDVTFHGPTASATTYAPVRARWLRSENGQRTGPDPAELAEVRERGARLYCAARKAQEQAGGRAISMGEKAAFSINPFGMKKIDFLVLEPTLALAGAKRRTGAGAADGAQAFEVPLLLGTRLTPVRGLGLPGLGELRAPLVLVSGDSEVVTPTPGYTRTTWETECDLYGCYGWPVYHTEPAREYQTVTHVDAIRSASMGADADAEIPLAYLGPLRIDLVLGLGYHVGELTVKDDRLLAQGDLGPTTGFPFRPRAGEPRPFALSGVSWHDGPWKYSKDSVDTSPRWMILDRGAGWLGPTAGTWPFPLQSRVLQSDDHAVELETRMSLTGGIGGSLGLPVGPVQISLDATGTLTGAAAQTHVVRDGLLATRDASGVAGNTALTVRPKMTAEATANLKVKVKLLIDVFVGKIKLEHTLVDTSTQLASWDSDQTGIFSEADTLRIGTGSQRGDVMKQPDVLSHLPHAPAYATFTQGVDACLADASPGPAEPPLAPPSVDGGGAPRAEICVHGGAILGRDGAYAPRARMPAGVCGNVDAYVAGLGIDQDKSRCLVDYLRFLCQPVSRQQVFGGHDVVARVIDPLNEQTMTTYAGIVGQCLSAYAIPNESVASAEAFARELFGWAACDGGANLIGASAAMPLDIDGHAPPVKAPRRIDQPLPGAATDIAWGGSELWVLGTGWSGAGHPLYRWDGATWQQVPGAATAIDVGPDGRPVVASSNDTLWRWNGSDWSWMPGAAVDVGIGADGTLWVVGTNPVPGGFGIYRWNASGWWWESIPGGGVAIDVGPDGRAVVVADDGTVWRWNGAAFEHLPGVSSGTDVGIGADGRIWVVDGDAVVTWNGAGWDPVVTGNDAARITGGPAGQAAIVGTHGDIYR
jgi:hypothetical protein